MKAIVIGTFLLLPLAAGEPAADEDAKKLHGYWKVVREVINGKETRKAELKNDILNFTDGAIVIYDKESVAIRFAYKLHPKLDPKGIDIQYKDKGGNDRLDRGIYRVTDKTLEICVQEDPKAERPKTFGSEKDSNMNWIVLEKVKVR